MRDFLVALAVVFAGIADFWNGLATQIDASSVLGGFLAVGFLELSISFSNLAQLALDGAVAAGEWETRIEALQDTLAETLLESALGEAITSIWPEFPEFVIDPGQWAIDTLSDVSPELAAFLIDPEAWVLAILESWLPIDIQASGFETIDVDGAVFYANEQTSVGSGFEFRIPEGTWDTVWASFYGYSAPAGRSAINVFHDGVLTASFAGGPSGVDGIVYGVSITSDPDGLAVGGLWRVLASTPGSMAFARAVYLAPGEGEPEPGSASIQLVGAVGPASWSLDWSGFIDWLEAAFLSIAEGLYALLERIVRYFWEGVY